MQKKQELIIIDSKFNISLIQRKKLKKFLLSELKENSAHYLVSFRKEVDNYAKAQMFYRKVIEHPDENFMEFLKVSKTPSRNSLFCFTHKGIFFLDLEEGASAFFRLENQENFVIVKKKQILRSVYEKWCKHGIFLVHGENLYKFEKYSFDKGPDVFQKYTPQIKHWALVYVTNQTSSDKPTTYFSSIDK